MKYISTRNSSESLPFESVFIKGLADDGGLFLPEKDYKFDEKDLSKLQSMSYYEPVSYTHLTLPTTTPV